MEDQDCMMIELLALLVMKLTYGRGLYNEVWSVGDLQVSGASKMIQLASFWLRDIKKLTPCIDDE